MEDKLMLDRVNAELAQLDRDWETFISPMIADAICFISFVISILFILGLFI